MEPDPQPLVEAQPHRKFPPSAFARTAEAAVNARQRASENGHSDPWAYRLCDQVERTSLPRRWLARPLERWGLSQAGPCADLVGRGSTTHKLPGIRPTSAITHWPNVTSIERPPVTFPRTHIDSASKPPCFASRCLAIGMGILGGFALGVAVGWSDLLTEASFGQIVAPLAGCQRQGSSMQMNGLGRNRAEAMTCVATRMGGGRSPSRPWSGDVSRWDHRDKNAAPGQPASFRQTCESVA
jgi:hypothetical protein